MKDTGERLIPKRHQKSLAYGEHLARYKAANSFVKGKVVLDIACGVGYGSKMLAQHAKKVIGVDISAEAINYAKKYYAAPNIDYQKGDALHMPLPDHSIDVVVSLETIEHLPWPEQFIKEIKRVLVTTGLFIVSTPNDDEFTEGNEFHVHEFDFKKLSELTKKYFKNSTYYYQGSWFASGVLSKESFINTFETSSLEVTKVFPEAAHKAIYYLAVASDDELQQAHENIVVADVYSSKVDQENHLARVQHINDLNALVEAHRAELKLKQAEKEQLQADLQGIYTSKGWKLLQRAYRTRDILKRRTK